VIINWAKWDKARSGVWTDPKTSPCAKYLSFRSAPIKRRRAAGLGLSPEKLSTNEKAPSVPETRSRLTSASCNFVKGIRTTAFGISCIRREIKSDIAIQPEACPNFEFASVLTRDTQSSPGDSTSIYAFNSSQKKSHKLSTRSEYLQHGRNYFHSRYRMLSPIQKSHASTKFLLHHDCTWCLLIHTKFSTFRYSLCFGWTVNNRHLTLPGSKKQRIPSIYSDGCVSVSRITPNPLFQLERKEFPPDGWRCSINMSRVIDLWKRSVPLLRSRKRWGAIVWQGWKVLPNTQGMDSPSSMTFASTFPFHQNDT